MIYKIAFNVVGIGMFVLLIFVQFKLFTIGVFIRQRNAKWIKNGWSGRLSIRPLKDLDRITEDEKSKQAIRVFLKYSRVSWILLVSGFLLLILIAYANSIANKT